MWAWVVPSERLEMQLGEISFRGNVIYLFQWKQQKTTH